MPLIFLKTFISAAPQVVFDLSRSVDLHKTSMSHHREEITDGTRKGLMNKGDTVTWKARHFWKSRTLKVKLTELDAPTFFADEMLEGEFKRMRHEHEFRPTENGTLMIDHFYFETPFGVIGSFVNILFLKNYMKQLLLERNAVIKDIAEKDQWKQYLNV